MRIIWINIVEHYRVEAFFGESKIVAAIGAVSIVLGSMFREWTCKRFGHAWAVEWTDAENGRESRCCRTCGEQIVDQF